MDETMKYLVEAMKAGDEEAFDQIYHRYAGRLYRTAYLISGNKEDSEDILQETFVKCFLHRQELKTPEYFEKWLMKIMIRTAWRTVKKRKVNVSSEELFEKEEYAGLAQAVFEDRLNPAPLEQIVGREEQARILRAIDDLDIKLKTVIVLYYYEELSVKEIAGYTGSLEGTVKSRLHTARKQLKQQLEETEYSLKGIRRTMG